jgi:nucleotide-binding universal stress UspA family protein
MVVSARHRNWLEKIFSRSVSQKLVMHAHIPIMVFHYKEHPVIFS